MQRCEQGLQVHTRIGLPCRCSSALLSWCLAPELEQPPHLQRTPAPRTWASGSRTQLQAEPTKPWSEGRLWDSTLTRCSAECRKEKREERTYEAGGNDGREEGRHEHAVHDAASLEPAQVTGGGIVEVHRVAVAADRRVRRHVVLREAPALAERAPDAQRRRRRWRRGRRAGGADEGEDCPAAEAHRGGVDWEIGDGLAQMCLFVVNRVAEPWTP